MEVWESFEEGLKGEGLSGGTVAIYREARNPRGWGVQSLPPPHPDERRPPEKRRRFSQSTGNDVKGLREARHWILSH